MANDPKLSLIAAIANNGVIGYQGKMPWNSKKDLQHFAHTTKHHVIIMGHATYRSIGKALPNRKTVVVSRNQTLTLDDCDVVNSLDEAINFAKQHETKTIYIAGGAQIYTQAMDMDIVDEMIISKIDISPEGDTYFPKFDKQQWSVTKRVEHLDQNPPFVIEWLTKNNL